MSSARSFIALALGVSALAGCGQVAPGLASGSGTRSALAAAAMPGQLVVKLRPQVAVSGWMAAYGLKPVRKIEDLGALVVQAADPTAALARLGRDSAVVYAEPNYVARKFEADARPFAGVFAADELLGQLWGMQKIGATRVWAGLPGDRKVTVAVVDTGIDHTHPDFSGRVLKGRDVVNNDDDAMDDEGHGTHCAGTIAAGLGNGGVVGVAPNVTLLAVKVLAANGSGSYAGVAEGIVYAANQGAPVISMSLGGSRPSKVLEDAVALAIRKGSLVVAAAGNDGSDEPNYPAAIKGVMAVSATQREDRIAYFSNTGNHVSVSAPGVSIMSTIPGGKYEALDGTSMACPHVSGLAALVKSKFPSANAATIRTRIEKSADDLGAKGFDPVFGHGRINVAKAVI
ncbi:MAG: S8 family serine peptidase [Candidatus Sericytochromatia bacterium]|nr:S8 family serine peptidase [Candidatus Sericytochromatia bacterium]